MRDAPHEGSHQRTDENDRNVLKSMGLFVLYFEAHGLMCMM